MRIYHNIPALTAYNSLNKTNNSMEKTIQKLSTGLRINSAADDAAGFAISEKMRAQIAGLEVAIRNTQDATSMLQVAEGALGETNSMLQRMRELAVQASNDTLTSQDRSYIQLEIDQLEDQIDRIAKTTQFNKKRLLDGSSAGITSSSNLSVKAYVRGSLREIDQFGQKKSFEGNYKIQVKVDPSQTGTGQVQKSSVMTIKHPNVITDVNVNNGIQKVAVDNVPAGDYSITRASSGSANAFEIDGDSFSTGDDTKTEVQAATEKAAFEAITLNVTAGKELNAGTNGAKITLTVESNDSTTVTLKATSSVKDDDGNYLSTTIDITGNDDISEDIGVALGLTDTAGVCKLGIAGADIAALVDNAAADSEISFKAITKPTLKDPIFSSAAETEAEKTAEKTAFNNAIGVTLDPDAELKVGNKGAKITFTVTAVDDTSGQESITLKATSSVKDDDGNYLSTTVTLDSSTTSVDLGDVLGLSDTAADFTIDLTAGNLADLVAVANVDSEIEYNISYGVGGSRLTGFYNAGARPGDADYTDALKVITFGSDGSQTANASVLFEVTGIDKTNNTVTLRATSNVLGTDGNVSNYLEDSIIVSASGKAIGESLGLGSDDACKLSIDATKIGKIEVGTKFAYNYTAVGTSAVNISAIQDSNWPDKWGDNGSNVTCNDEGSYVDGNPVTFGLNEQVYDLNSKDIHFRNFYINGDNGTVYEGDIILTTESDFTTQVAAAKEGDKLASFTAAYIGKTATLDTKLRDLNTFWNSSGVFMLETPQTITINQGDGKSATVTIYGTDTIRELEAKFNEAIGKGLGQAAYVDGSGASKFCTFVEKGAEDTQGLETVAGTFIFRSVLPGADGDMTFSGDEDLINTFALNVVQNSSTAAFRASIYDAHTGIAVNGATNVKVSDNKLVGVLHPNVDIEFDATANIKARWSEVEKNFILEPETDAYEAIIHIVDSSTVFQIGANEGEDIAIDIGNMSAGSLGVTNINVSTRESAARSLGLIDAAINKVSSQRAKIGAYQNALEYTSENLTTTMTNLTAAESRIRDADMAATMMEFVKLQILNQSGTSMLAQANQLPQSVLSLLNG